MKNIKKILLLLIPFATLVSCNKDFLQQTPSDRPSEETLFSSLEGAQINLNGIYALQNYYYGEGTRGILAPDIMGEDCLVVSSNNYSRYIGFYRYNLTVTSGRPLNFYKYSYRTIANCNLFLKNIEKLDGDEKKKNDLIAQALALRAFSYFSLIRWFGETSYTENPNGRGVPITIKVEPLDSYNIPRSTVGDVYKQIISDLEKAEKYSLPSDYKGFIDAQAVSAIQARVYLTMGDWNNASKYAKKGYKGFTLMKEEEYLGGFNATSSEAIWEQRFVDSDVNTFLSLPSFTYTSGDIVYKDNTNDGIVDYKDLNRDTKGENFQFGYNSLRVTRNFINQFSDTDFRKKMFPVCKRQDGSVILNKDGSVAYAQWFTDNGYLTTKYRSISSLGTGDFPRIRASEMYLIEAEAEANLGNYSVAQEALYKIQKRADASAVKSVKTGDSLLEEIYLERRKELFYEGHAFFDLKRLDKDLNRTTSATDQWSDFTNIGQANKYIIVKNSKSKRFCLPIPQDEIDANKALTNKDQNLVYQ